MTAMRMRKKKNLQKRLDGVGDYLIGVERENLTVPELIWLTHPCADENAFEGEASFGVPPKKHPIDARELFGNGNPLHLEIGCGKGQFAVEAAKRNPKINFIAVEVNRSVIVQACEKAQREKVPNLKFFMIGAEMLPIYIPKGSVDRIYLNFSTPFPKKSQAKHRLTHENFLNVYKFLLSPGGEIFQKTDNAQLFEFSICEFSRCGFILSNVTLDLHTSDCEDNIITEYEEKFLRMGQPIFRLEAGLKP